MAKTIVSQPSAIFPAYNPAPLVIGASNSEADVEMHLVIDGVSVTHHKREFFSFAEPLTDNFGEPITDNDGMPIPIGGVPVAVFDIGKIARNYFSNALVEVNAAQNADPYTKKAYVDRRLCCPFTASVTGVDDVDFVAVNAALAPGLAEASYSEWADKFLTESPLLRFYAGYTDKSKLSALVSTGNDSAVAEFIGGVAYELDFYIDSAVVLQSWVGAESATFAFSDDSITVSRTTENATDINDTIDMLFAGINQDTSYVATIVTVGGVKHLHIVAPIGDRFLALPTLTMPKILYSTRVIPSLSEAAVKSYVGDGAGKVVSIEIPFATDGFLWGYEYVDLANEAGILSTLPMSFDDIPPAPFYVRWVNHIGGREHFMFCRRQTDKTDIDDSVTFDPYIETNADLGRYPRQVSLTSERTVVVGAEGIPTAEYDVLRKITTSPLIEYYDTVSAKWIVVTVKSGATSKDTASPMQSIELEFNLPSPALQF